MKKSKIYFEHPDVAVKADDRFEHVMALTLNPRSGHKDGVVRCIMNRKGYIDKSELYKVKADSLTSLQITERLYIEDEKEIIDKYRKENHEFLGLEDPDIWIEDRKDIVHLYFTIAFRNKDKDDFVMWLGHAEGKDLDSLKMTEPVLMDVTEKNMAKELAVSPINSKGTRCNLIESNDEINGFYYSTVRIAEAKDMEKPWKFGKTIFHPYENSIPWIAEHASPAFLFSKNFIDLRENKLLGIINGRGKSKKVNNKTKYAMFSIGIFVYDHEKGKIDWVSPDPFIQDSQATTITFASDFVETKKGEGVLFAHVDDSLVRAYSIKARDLKRLLPKEFLQSKSF